MIKRKFLVTYAHHLDMIEMWKEVAPGLFVRFGDRGGQPRFQFMVSEELIRYHRIVLDSWRGE
jgi:hypothetical protein